MDYRVKNNWEFFGHSVIVFVMMLVLWAPLQALIFRLCWDNLRDVWPVLPTLTFWQAWSLMVVIRTLIPTIQVRPEKYDK